MWKAEHHRTDKSERRRGGDQYRRPPSSRALTTTPGVRDPFRGTERFVVICRHTVRRVAIKQLHTWTLLGRHAFHGRPGTCTHH
jgi:hypothetical protein